MTFQAYLDNIQAKTGLSPNDFRRLAAKRGFVGSNGLVEGIKVSDIVNWLANDYRLGRGHAMAIVALLKGRPRGRAPTVRKTGSSRSDKAR
ncbi:MAG: DUF4287 domain-containing protein [Steroidobacteraceae bacterium]